MRPFTRFIRFNILSFSPRILTHRATFYTNTLITHRLKMTDRTFKLNTGADIPALGLGKSNKMVMIMR